MIADERAIPTPGTVERWAWDFVFAESLERKLAPSPPPSDFEVGAPARRPLAPTRPAPLTTHGKAKKQRGFASPSGRARAMHTFFHHELQPAELFAFALLAFPDAPIAIRRGFVRILLDEVRHANLYATEVERLGLRIGAFPVRDWFWERIPRCEDVVSFVATMGLGFEAGNLDHASRFERIFRDVGDERAAAVQATVAREEIAHVGFAAAAFERLRGPLEFDAWASSLPAPLSPMLMRGERVNRDARRAAHLHDRFLDRLEAWTAERPSS